MKKPFVIEINVSLECWVNIGDTKKGNCVHMGLIYVCFFILGTMVSFFLN